ncbi:hypothetical protein RQP46_004287 [Phenoliferia psychrophenolica]
MSLFRSTHATLTFLRPSLTRTAVAASRFPSRNSSTSAPSSHPNPWAEKLPRPISEMGTYLVTLPDFADSKRLSVRPAHIEHAVVGHSNGWIVAGGALLANEPAETGEAPQMRGSWLLIRGVSKEDALARLGKDLYAVRGAWDMSKVTISTVAVANLS